MKKKISIILALTMILSGCNTAEKAEQTTAEVTTTAETTVVTTATTAETTTTTLITDISTPSETIATAETEELVEAESFDLNFTREDFTMDLSVFEKYFYGSWNEQSEYPMRRTFTYNEDSFIEGRYYCLGFYEDETGGYMLTMNGGVHELYFVLADSPDTMYTRIDFNFYYKDIGYCDVYKADENNSELSHELTAGTLDSIGVLKLKADYGFDVKSFNSFTDPYGTEWRFDYDFHYYESIPFYSLEAKPTAEKIIFSQRYICKNEPHKVRRFISTAENQNGEWVITDTLSDFSDESIVNYFYVNEDPYYAVSRIGFLKNKDFEAEINEFIEESIEYIEPFKEEFDEKFSLFYRNSDKLWVYPYIKNGYLSITVGLVKYNVGMGFLSNDWYVCRTAVFDIINKRKVEDLSELFPKGYDYEKAITDYLKEYVSDEKAEYLMASDYQFTATSIIFGYDEERLKRGNELKFGDYADEFVITNEPRDYSEYVTCGVNRNQLCQSTLCEYTYQNEEVKPYVWFTASRFLTKEEIAASNAAAIKAQKELCRDFEMHSEAMPEFEYSNYFILHCGNYIECGLESYTELIRYLYDLSGNRLTVGDLLKENNKTDDMCDCGKSFSEHYVSNIEGNKSVTVKYLCGDNIFEHSRNLASFEISGDYVRDIYK